MLPVTEVLPERFTKLLRQHNIRFAEQFISMTREASTLHALAAALDCSIDDLRKAAHEIEAKHPDLDVPPSRGKEHGLGYGKKTDLNRFSR